MQKNFPQGLKPNASKAVMSELKLRPPKNLRFSAASIEDAQPGVTADYAEIVDAETFEPVTAIRRKCLVLIAAFVGGTRLIDNALVEPEGEGFRVTL